MTRTSSTIVHPVHFKKTWFSIINCYFMEYRANCGFEYVLRSGIFLTSPVDHNGRSS